MFILHSFAFRGTQFLQLLDSRARLFRKSHPYTLTFYSNISNVGPGKKQQEMELWPNYDDSSAGLARVGLKGGFGVAVLCSTFHVIAFWSDRDLFVGFILWSSSVLFLLALGSFVSRDIRTGRLAFGYILSL